MDKAKLFALLRKPYILMIENDGGNGAALAVSLGRAPDNHASWGGLRYATFHYAKFEDMIDGLRKAHCATGGRPGVIMVSDVRVQLSLPRVGHAFRAEDQVEARLTIENSLCSSSAAPFVVGVEYPCDGYDATEIAGRAPSVEVGQSAIFTFCEFDEAVAVCTRLAIVDGTYGDIKQMNPEIN